MFCSWVLDTNYVSVTRPCYGSRLPWFYKLWYPDRRLKRDAEELIRTIYPDSYLRPDAAEPYILHKAQHCISLLSDKLGSSDFFILPHSPCSLDALIFSYLAPFLKIPIPHCPVKEYIRATPNLERYVARISHRYFSAFTGKYSELADMGTWQLYSN
jgi:metaxin